MKLNPYQVSQIFLFKRGPIPGSFARYLVEGDWAPEKGFRTMQMEEAMIEDNSNALKDTPSGGEIGNWMTRLFGCWHKEMSRPFASQGQTYRTCLNCGASRRFNVGRWEMQGDFFYRRPAWQ